MTIDLKNLTIEKARKALDNKEFSAVDLASAYLDEIKKKNKELNAYLEVFDDVLEQAKVADEMIARRESKALTGIPFAIKDNILIEGHICSAGSKILENYKASYDATVIKDLKKVGAVFLGRTNMDEFAMGSSTQTSAYGVTRNPIDTSRVPGGSSGGSAAALAGGMTLAAIGTETCGSVREPSAFCGLVGLKPTYGALSRQGIIAMGNSLDQVSPFGKCVRDAEIIFDFLSRYDEEDSTSVSLEKRNPKIKNSKKIGVPWHLFAEGVDKEVLENFKQSLEKFKKAGYEIVDIELPHAKYSLAAYYIIMPAEVSTNLARFDGIRYGFSVRGKEAENLKDVYIKSRGRGFGKEARRRILLGTYVLSHGYYDAYYNKAVKVREKIKEEVIKAFETVSYVLTPTVPITAFKIGEKMDDPVAMYLCDIFSAPANLAGVPSLALPSGLSSSGLSFSIQFMAPHFCESSLFEVGKKFEEIRENKV